MTRLTNLKRLEKYRNSDKIFISETQIKRIIKLVNATNKDMLITTCDFYVARGYRARITFININSKENLKKDASEMDFDHGFSWDDHDQFFKTESHLILWLESKIEFLKKGVK